MERFVTELSGKMKEREKLEAAIKVNLKEFGYEI